MKSQSVALSLIAFDAGTQIRAAINEQVVTEYAERMNEGAVFPPVVLFHDGNSYYMGDGFHRAMAAKRNGLTELPCDVKQGTKVDALWFALGANRGHGVPLTQIDKQHAVLIALRTWPDKLHREIAEHVGCSTGLISQVSSKNTAKTGEKLTTGRALHSQQKRQAIKDLIANGEKRSDDIAKKTNTSSSFVSKVRAEMGLQCFDRTKAGIVKRRAVMRQMASEGHTSMQIAAAVGMSLDGCRNALRDDGVSVPGDAATRNAKRHDSNRIVEQMVMDAEHLTGDINLIDYKALDADRLGDWLDSLTKSKQALSAFIRRLTEEHKKHGQAAYPAVAV